MSEICSALGRDNSGGPIGFFHEYEHVNDDVHRVRIGGISFLCDDGDENVLTFLWRDPKVQSSICCRVRRSGHSVVDCDGLKDDPRMAKYDIPMFYISDQDSSLAFNSYSETVGTDEDGGGAVTYWTKGGQIATPTE